MKQEDSPTTKSKRGRPRSEENSQVVQKLMDTTELLLRTYNHINLTERRISEKSGVDNKMIRYYFEDKDGLIFAIIVRYCDNVALRLKELDRLDFTSISITRQIIKILVEAIYEKPWISRIVASEFSRSHSPVQAYFLKKYGPHGVSLGRIREIIEKLIDCGVYSLGADVDRAVLAIIFLLSAPAMLAPISGSINTELNEFKSDSWIDYISEIFDQKLRPDHSK